MIQSLRDDSTSTEKQSLDQTKRKKISSSIRWGKFFLLILFAVTFFSACKDPDDSSLNVLPQGEQLATIFSDTVTVKTLTIADDSLKTDELSNQLIGCINDPVFGITNASVFAQVNLEGTPIFTNIPVADSLVLSLVYTGSYGDTTATQSVDVYKLTESLYQDSTYYSNRTFAYNSTAIGSVQFQPRPKTKVFIGTDTLAAQVRIALDKSIGDSILNLYGRTELSSNTEFLNYFKGIYIKPTATPSLNTGAISYFSFTSSKLTLYFHDTTSVAKTYVFSLAGGRINHFEHDRGTSDVGMQLIDSTQNDTLNYIQAMCGVKTRISFPYLKNYNSAGRIILNRAELSFTLKEGSGSAQYTPPLTTLLITRNTAGQFTLPIDYYESSGYFGGNIGSSGNSYKFNITRQLQRYLDGAVQNTDFDLVISGSGVSASRMVIGSGKNAVYPMKLSLYYTKIN